MSKGGKTAVWVGLGCLGCIGLPMIVLAAGAGGWFLASSKYEAEIAFEKALDESLVDQPVRAYGDDEDEEEASDAELRAREEQVIAELLRAAEKEAAKENALAALKATPTPTPVVMKATPTPTPVRATPTPVRVAVATPVRKAATPTPTPAALAKPAPTSTPRKFESLEIDSKAKPTTTKVASAANAATADSEDDVAVAALFGDELPPPSDAPGKIDPKRRIIKTKSGARDVTLGKKIALQGSDKKTVIGTLEKVEGGWVAIRPADGKVKMIAEADLIDASEL